MAAFVYTGKETLKTDVRGENECLRFAAEEFAKYARMVLASSSGGAGTGRKTAVFGCGEAFCREAGIDPAGLRWDGFAVSASENTVCFASLEARGTLFAVYEFFRANGCKFIKGARVRERIPQAERLVFDGVKVYNPSFAVRSLATTVYDETETWRNETVEFVDWCAKNNINTVFLHQSVQTPLKGRNAEVCREIFRRGLRLEFGGHSAEQYISRELFGSQPERFICKAGERTPKGNFCTSDERNLAELKEQACAYLRENPGIEVLHVWFEDVLEGSWCECEKCRGMRAGEQQLRAVNAIAEGVAQEFPGVRVDMLLYHDTLENISSLPAPASNVVAVFAPRERCYGHSVADESCALNTSLRGTLAETIRKFGVENVCTFDYYMDYVLFSKTKVAVPHVIAEDMAYYRDAGIRQVCSLSFGLYSYWAYDLNFYVYARHSFDAGADVGQTIAQYIEDFGLPEGYGAYIAELEAFSRSYFAFCGYRADWYYDIRFLGLCPYFGEHIKKIERAAKHLERAQELLAGLRASAADGLQDYFRYEEELLRLTAMEVKGIHRRMCVRFENYRESPADKTQLRRSLESIKPILYKMIDMMEEIPEDVKGIQGGKTFREHLCKDQIWTLNELMSKELHLDVNLDRSII